MMKLAEIMPRLEKATTVRISASSAGKIAAPAKLTPKNRPPRSRYTPTRREVKAKLHCEEESTILERRVGVTSIASRVPIICSDRMLLAKLPRPTERKFENAIPMSTKEK